MSIGKGSYFRRYWIGEALSTLGTRTGNIAYPLLALELTGSPAKAGLLAFGRSAAWFVLSLPAGAIVEVSAAMLLSIKKSFHEEREHEPWSVRTHLTEIRSGVTWLFAQPFLRTATLLVGGANFVGNAVSLLLVVVVRERGGSAPEIGLMMSFAAAGSLLGALAATRLHRVVAPRLIVVGYPWLGALAALLIALPLQPLALGAIYGSWVFFGPTWDAVVGGHRIRIVPDAMQGRVESVTGLVAIGGAALGPLVGGVLASRLTGSAAFVCIAAIGACIALAGVAAWSRGLRTISAEAPA